MPLTRRRDVWSETPLVSIVTPSYNAVGTIEQAVQSTQCQDHPNIEHLVVDGASTDGTLTILERYSDRVTWLSGPDEGQSDALNKGFALAQGEIIGWLNADDVYYPGAVSRAVAHLLTHPDVAMVYSDFEFIGEQGQCLKRIPARDFSLEKLLLANIVPQVTMFFRRQVLEDVGGLSADYDFVMDWEFVLRVARRHLIQRIPGTSGGFRLTSSTKSVAQAPKFWPEVVSMLERAHFLEELLPRTVLAEARHRAHLYAGIEFVRVGAIALARPHFEQAFSRMNSDNELAAAKILPGIISTIVFPWHEGGRESPTADRCLESLCRTLPKTKPGYHLTGLLRLYQGYQALKRRRFVMAFRRWRCAFQTWPGLWKDLSYVVLVQK